MAWVLVSGLSAATFAVVNVLDKQLIGKYLPSVESFNLWLGLNTLATGVLLWLLLPLPAGTSPAVVGWALASGFVWGLGIMAMFFAFKTEEVSRAVPVYHTYPIFVALLAIPVLGERLSTLQWLAVLATVAGAGLASLRRVGDGGLRRLTLGPAFWLLTLGSALTAVALTITKVTLNDLPFLQALALRNVGLGAAFLYFLRPAPVRHVLQGLHHPTTRWTMVAAESVLAPVASLLTVWAISLGPVSLVSAVTGVRPLFVFLYSTLLSAPWWRVMDEPLEGRTLAVKLAAALLVVGGIFGLALL